jgi:transcriptional regulator with XRE-family HTH domain
MKKIFSEFCKKNKITMKCFAKQCNIKISTLYLYNQGRRTPSTKAIKKLEQVTNGEINFYTFFPKQITTSPSNNNHREAINE